MKIKNKHFQSIWYDEDAKAVFTFDQRLLPFEVKIIELKSCEDAIIAIKDMKVRGAPLIGATAAWAMYLAVNDLINSENCEDNLIQAAEKVKVSRPTAIDLFKAVDRQLLEINKGKSNSSMLGIAKETAELISSESIFQCKSIGEHGLKIIEEASKKKITSGQNDGIVNILTHCNAGWLATVDYGTATAPMYLAHDKGIKIHVWVDETRPRNQGANITAFELGEHGIPHTVIADNTGGHLMQHGMVDLVIVGTDRTTKTGDVANKIGTYLKALAAYDNKVPFYVAAPSSSIDFTLSNGIEEIPIEERSEDEVKYIQGFDGSKISKLLIVPKNSNAKNYGFDVTPSKYVSALITERGICEANESSISKMFPEFL